MELIIYGAGVPIRLYSSQIYLDKEYHLNNADDRSKCSATKSDNLFWLWWLKNIYAYMYWEISFCDDYLKSLSNISTYSASFLTQVSSSIMWLPINHTRLLKYGAAVRSLINASMEASSTRYTFKVKVRTAIRTMPSEWLKNLIASVYNGKSLVCW